ncbi:hypothetical protein EL26_06265 [Tumebacillus flagellatus]|uniref:Uncharacterized protein n=1 Tax=Tumebacillus flagellatus TaxID=1157490 RepID=A0A074LSG9_9BACL|nr:hypothetical protein EL26_06265 [Tumebacillus flagellatus]
MTAGDQLVRMLQNDFNASANARMIHQIRDMETLRGGLFLKCFVDMFRSRARMPLLPKFRGIFNS